MPIDLIPTIIPSPEVTPQNPTQGGQIESAPQQEKAPTPSNSPTDPDVDNQNTDTAPQTEPAQSQPLIVDKTKEPETLRPVGSNADTLTTIADEEEEEFIEKVLEEHKS